MPNIAVSKPFRISKTEMARVSTLQYLKTCWFLLVGIPAAGIFIMFFIQDRLGMALGTIFLLWPISIPGRVLIVSWRKVGTLSQSTLAVFTEQEIFLNKSGETKGTRIPADWVRKFWSFGDIFIVEGYRLNFVLLRKSAFTVAEQIQIEDLIKRWIGNNRKAIAGTPNGSSPNQAE